MMESDHFNAFVPFNVSSPPFFLFSPFFLFPIFPLFFSSSPVDSMCIFLFFCVGGFTIFCGLLLICTSFLYGMVWLTLSRVGIFFRDNKKCRGVF